MRVVFTLIFLLVCSHQASAAEIYFGGGAGTTQGATVSDFEETQCLGLIGCNERTVLIGSNLDSDNGLAWGLKAGMFFSRPGLSWLGFEAQYFQRQINFPLQPWQANGTETTLLVPAVPFNGQASLAMSSLKTLSASVLIRIPPNTFKQPVLDRFVPYLGIGVSANTAKMGPMHTFDNAGNLLGSTGKNQVTSGFGFLFTAGLNVRLASRWNIYMEYKFNKAFMGDMDEFDRGTSGQEFNTSMDITDDILMFGLTFSFSSPGSEKPEISSP